MKRIEVGVLGATGMVGQNFTKLLEGHPWFELTWLGASDRSAGKKFRDATAWRLENDMPESTGGLVVADCKPANAPQLLFSAMDASVATEIEQEFAKAGHVVVSNSRNHRMEPDVPLLVPEINPGHLALVKTQRGRRGWMGYIVTNPNCSTVVLTMALGPLVQFGIDRVMAATLQAVSGAGYPGVPSLDIIGNAVPFIGGEEEKMQEETQKILGSLDGETVRPHPARVSAQCHRVAVVDGHMVSASVEFRTKPSADEIKAAWETFTSVPQERKLPSAPARPVVYLQQQDRPQPRRDAMRANGMVVSVGRLRPCPVLDLKFSACGHNTIRGAAGAAILNAELMMSEGLLD